MTSDGLLFADPADDAQEEWDGIAAEAPVEENTLYLELDGWEGPLDLLLDLARRQKVDLRSISILSLVDQYLGYIDQAEIPAPRSWRSSCTCGSSGSARCAMRRRG